jgi:hypothetical protein
MARLVQSRRSHVGLMLGLGFACSMDQSVGSEQLDLALFRAHPHRFISSDWS